jgi:hypothetical protein
MVVLSVLRLVDDGVVGEILYLALLLAWDVLVLFRANFKPIDGPEILRQEKVGGDAVVHLMMMMMMMMMMIMIMPLRVM